VKQALRHWLPALFCACLSVIALTLWARSSSERWNPVFFAFLPVCFVFFGLVTSSMHREISALQSEVAELRSQRRT
jgi:hypothetical protein